MIIAITMVRDESDIIAETLTRMAAEVDHLIVADNGSQDATRSILSGLSRELPLTVIDDPEVAYFQSRKMSTLAMRAAEMGADIVIPFDADERWYSPFGRIADVLGDHPRASIFGAALYDHVPTGADPDGSPMKRMGWRRRESVPLQKVACRTRPAVRIHQGNHGADYGEKLDGLLVVRHYPYRSPDQFVRKVRNGSEAYAATDLPTDQGAHWRGYGRILDASGPEVLIDEVFRKWFWVADPASDRTLIWDPTP